VLRVWSEACEVKEGAPDAAGKLVSTQLAASGTGNAALHLGLCVIDRQLAGSVDASLGFEICT
jgi:hypothetical protein